MVSISAMKYSMNERLVETQCVTVQVVRVDPLEPACRSSCATRLQEKKQGHREDQRLGSKIVNILPK